MKKENNILRSSIIGLFVLLLSLNFILAFGPISSYSLSNPLTIYAGESKDTSYNIYPTPEEGNLKIKAIITEGSDIARIIDESNIYDASPDNAGIVHIKISVPSTASVGSEYIVKLKFIDETIRPSGGTVGLSLESENSFKIIVIEKPAEDKETISPIWWVLVVILIIAIIAVIWFVVKNK